MSTPMHALGGRAANAATEAIGAAAGAVADPKTAASKLRAAITSRASGFAVVALAVAVTALLMRRRSS